MRDLDDIIFKEELEGAGSGLLSRDSAEVQTVMRVGNRLVQAHSSLATKMWQVAVIDSPEVNCYCLSSGRIVIYTGMLQSCENEDQLAAVLAHEMAHVLLQHQNIKLSHECLVDALMLPITFLSWCLSSSDLLSLLLTGLVKESSSIALLLPYSRQLETEADLIGLTLLTQACYDSREASAFWQILESTEEQSRVLKGDALEGTVSRWLSTHPSHKERYQLMDHCIPGALKWREKLKCPRLSPVDPRDRLQQPPRHSGPPSPDDYFGIRRSLQSCPSCRKRRMGANPCVCFSTTSAEYITLPPGVCYDQCGHPTSSPQSGCCDAEKNDSNQAGSKGFRSVVSLTADSILSNRRLLPSVI